MALTYLNPGWNSVGNANPELLVALVAKNCIVPIRGASLAFIYGSADKAKVVL